MLKGTITKILSQKENNWGRYQIESVGDDIIAIGVIPEASAGSIVTLEGNFEINKYGKQFKITQVISSEADKFAGIRRFFSDGYMKGIGPTKANAIITAFGKDSLSKFETEEGRKELCSVKGLSEKTINTAYESYKKNKVYADIVIFLNGTGTQNQVEQIYNKYKENTISVIKKNPYRLQMDIDGFGFMKTDKIALASGIKPDSIYRLMAAAKYALDEAQSEGHCFLEAEEIRSKVLALLVPTPSFDGVSKKAVENAITDWNNKKADFVNKHSSDVEVLSAIENIVETRSLISQTLSEALLKGIEDEEFVIEDGHIYTKKMFELEESVAKRIALMARKNPVRYISADVVNNAIKDVERRKTEELKAQQKGIAFEVTSEQRESIFLGAMHRICIVSGGPGCGKTTDCEVIAHAFLSAGKEYHEDDIIMIAPTGRAAQRIIESTGYQAMTAQRAILQAKKTNSKPKDKLIIVDEMSMVDIYLMNNILEYAEDCNLVLVGDVHQIASVGPGKVLTDMIGSGKIPFILLTQGHRNSSSIAHNAKKINDGLTIDKYTYDHSFVYRGTNVDQLPSLLINDYKEKVEQYGIQNVMLCTAMIERGPLAVNKLNRILQDSFTKGKPEAKFGDRIYRVGDRVMHIKNCYQFVKMIPIKGQKGYTEETGVFNGEKGTVIKILPDPENESYKMIVQFDDGSLAGYTRNTECYLTLAYAITLHKCQGSEADCMMMAYCYGDYMLINRSLFYTGETRAKKEFRFYGEEKIMYDKVCSVFDLAVKKLDDKKRNTGLEKKISMYVDNVVA